MNNDDARFDGFLLTPINGSESDLRYEFLNFGQVTLVFEPGDMTRYKFVIVCTGDAEFQPTLNGLYIIRVKAHGPAEHIGITTIFATEVPVNGLFTAKQMEPLADKHYTEYEPELFARFFNHTLRKHVLEAQRNGN